MKIFRPNTRANASSRSDTPSVAVAQAVEDGLPQPQRSLAFITIGIAIMMAVLDSSIMNVALPTIAAQQGVSPAASITVVTAFQIAVVMSLLPFAALGESLGFRKVYFFGVMLFGSASFLCAQSQSIEVLSAARVLQGLGAGALMSINGAMVRHIMPANQIGRGIANISLIVGISAASGPTVAGAILSVASWHWLFLINVPLCLIVLVSGLLTLPRMEGTWRRFDWISAILNGAAFGLLITGLTLLGRDGFSALVVAQFIGSVLAMAALTLRMMGSSAPMLPIDLLRIRPFAMAIIASICSFTAQFIVFVSLPFFFFNVLGRTAVETGLLLTPWPVATAIIAPFAGRLADRYSAEYLSVIGMVLLGFGFFGLLMMPEAPENFDLIWRLTLCGMGFGLFQAPNNKVVMTTAPRARSGGASGMQSTARVLGQSFGAALAALLIGARVDFVLAPLMAMAMAFCGIAIVATLIRANDRRKL